MADPTRLQQMIDSMNQQEAEEEQAANPAVANLLRNPLYLEIIRLLIKYPILVGATCKWLMERESMMAQAQLGVLYTPEELAAMREQRAKSDAKK